MFYPSPERFPVEIFFPDTKIFILRCPKVAVLSTGNELQDPKEGEPLKAGHIRDSNKTTLLALLQEHGFSAIDMGIAPDE